MELLSLSVFLVVFFLSIFLVPAVLFLVSQQNTLKAIQPHNRLMQPGEVWLQLIPLFGLVWQFIVVKRIAESLEREFESWKGDSFLADVEAIALSDVYKRPTYDIGMAYCILICLSVIPFLGSFASIAALICWIIYWVRLVEYKNRVLNRGY